MLNKQNPTGNVQLLESDQLKITDGRSGEA